MKFTSNDKAEEFSWFPGINIWILFYFFNKLDLSVFVDLEKFQPWYIRSELGSTKTSSFIYGLCEVCFKW